MLLIKMPVPPWALPSEWRGLCKEYYGMRKLFLLDEEDAPNTWSQQVDEASFENLASPNDDNFVGNHNLTQFQYPPFNAKENQNVAWSNFKTRKSSNNSEITKKYGKSSYYNNSKRDDSQSNAWNTINSKKNISDSSGNFLRYNKGNQEFVSGRLDNRPSVIPIEEKKSNITPILTAPKKTTWASIASQPAKLTLRTTLITSSHKKKGPGMPPPPMVPGKHNLDVNTWDVPNNNPPPVPSPPPPMLNYTKINLESSTKIGFEQDYSTHIEKGHKEVELSKDDNESTYICHVGRLKNSPNGHSRKSWPSSNHQSRHGGSFNSRMPTRSEVNTNAGSIRYTERKLPYNAFNDISHELREEKNVHINEQTPIINESSSDSPQAVLDELRDKNNYNPANIDLEKAAVARFFVIKSYSEDDIHRSIKYEIWCSTDHGNKRLDDAFKERQKEGGNVLLFFSVNGSGHFCGMAQMMTPVDYNSTSSVWSQDKWKGKFKVKWIYVKDVHNNKLRHILLENNENKSVTYSRDTQEVPNAKGIEVLQILHSFQHKTSIFDDFYHYEKKQEEELSSKKTPTHEYNNSSQNHSPNNRHYNRQNDESRGSGASKYFSSNSGSSFRDRNNSHRNSNYHNYNEHRRYDAHRVCSTTDYQHRDIDTDREGSEYGNRYQLKFDYNRRDERTQSKQNNRERDFSNENHNKNDMRYRSIKEMQKDNEYPITDRVRGTDY